MLELVLLFVINFVYVRAFKSVSVVELSIFAGENFSTRGDHLWCKGELLAVKLKGVAVVF